MVEPKVNACIRKILICIFIEERIFAVNVRTEHIHLEVFSIRPNAQIRTARFRKFRPSVKLSLERSIFVCVNIVVIIYVIRNRIHYADVFTHRNATSSRRVHVVVIRKEQKGDVAFISGIVVHPFCHGCLYVVTKLDDCARIGTVRRFRRLTSRTGTTCFRILTCQRVINCVGFICYLRAGKRLLHNHCNLRHHCIVIVRVTVRRIAKLRTIVAKPVALPLPLPIARGQNFKGIVPNRPACTAIVGIITHTIHIIQFPHRHAHTICVFSIINQRAVGRHTHFKIGAFRLIQFGKFHRRKLVQYIRIFRVLFVTEQFAKQSINTVQTAKRTICIDINGVVDRLEMITLTVHLAHPYTRVCKRLRIPDRNVRTVRIVCDIAYHGQGCARCFRKERNKFVLCQRQHCVCVCRKYDCVLRLSIFSQILCLYDQLTNAVDRHIRHSYPGKSVVRFNFPAISIKRAQIRTRDIT